MEPGKLFHQPGTTKENRRQLQYTKYTGVDYVHRCGIIIIIQERYFSFQNGGNLTERNSIANPVHLWLLLLLRLYFFVVLPALGGDRRLRSPAHRVQSRDRGGGDSRLRRVASRRAAGPERPTAPRLRAAERSPEAAARTQSRPKPSPKPGASGSTRTGASTDMHAQRSPKGGLSCKMVLQAVGKVLRKSKTKPNGKKPQAEEKKHYLDPEYTKVRVVDFDLKELVVLPREIDLNEWLASNTTTFFNLINLQYSTVSEFCTGDTCQAMTAYNTIFPWQDEKGKKTKCTAPQYVDFVMSLVQKLVTDEEIFPTKYGKEFPNSFESLVKKICRYLFHVLAHIYWAHFKETVALDLHGHLNTLYAHFIVFVREFNLVESKETCIMDDLAEVLCTPLPSAQNHVTER
ncbi:MOB kinase activator 2a isoform X1 [Denticeps clupeoides]|nr:MOB kinase activator 2-like isoform X1 [Denticeps clupeoides]